MTPVGNVSPLIAVDALVIDTETTGLDPRKAWIVEIAAVRLTAGRLDLSSPFNRRVRPGMAIPAAATRIHGIDDAAVAGAPPFAAIAPDVAALIDGTLLI
jgi:DNA polymerase-3 subunit epsilon/CBS domain-containing protein